MSSEIYYGVVEDRDTDPKKLGRCRVRIVGIHTENKTILPTKDLPWAYPLMPVHSASMSGIGFSPTGMVEGTWVAVTFRDQYQQQPIIIGTIGGIPEDDSPEQEVKETYKTTIQETLKDSTGNTVLDGSGNPVIIGQPKEQTVTEIVQPPSDIKKVSQMTISDTGLQFIMNQEAISSLTKGKNHFTKRVLDPLTPIYSYQDSGGKWTIGYGSTFLADGSKVGPNTVIQAKDAKSLLNRHITQEVEKYLKGVITAPLTQQMYDALIDMAYNAGGPALAKSTIITSINTQKYEEAAAFIPMWRATVKGVINKGLVSRRLREQEMFLSGGIPNPSFSYVDKLNPSPQAEERAKAEAEAQQIKLPNKVSNTSTSGFKDPNGIYPIDALKGEPDTNRLARHDKIHETIVFAKEAARAKRIRMPYWIKRKKEWSQPSIPYNAAYPFNQTRTTESGHVEEWDDTKGSERIHRYHKSGTFEEIDSNGTRVTRIVGDSYEILERNGNLVVRGSVNITVQGNAEVRVENNAYFEVLGDLNTRVTGKWTHKSRGDIKFSTEGKFEVDTLGEIKIHSDKTILTEAIGDINQVSAGNIDIGAIGNITERASRIDLNPGGTPSSPINLAPEEWEESQGAPKFSHLVVIDRTIEASAQYESPHEGDASAFRDGQVARGEYSMPDLTAPAQETGESVESSVASNTDDESTPDLPLDKNKEIEDDLLGEIGPYMRLSPNYRLYDILGNSEKGKVPTDSFGGRAQVKLTQKQVLTNLKWMANNVMEPIRAQFPNVLPTSSWRSATSNKGLKGASTKSDHLIAGAIDMVFEGFDNKKLIATAKTIVSMLPTYNQIIIEYKSDKMWIHVSVFSPKSGLNNAKQIGTMNIDKGGKWLPGFLLKENT